MDGLRQLLAALLAITLWPAIPAQAAWLKAESAHFVVYADDSERDLTRFTERLERYHVALEIITGLDLPDPSPSNRVTVYVARNEREIRRLFGDANSSVAGFYIGRAGSSAAFVPRLSTTGLNGEVSLAILLHEYAHHFLLSNGNFSPPQWYGEGSAEFFASARFEDDGGLSIGLPNELRYNEFRYAENVPAEALLDPAVLERSPRRGFTSFYGKSWLLFHYLTFDPDRRGQLGAYIAALARGTPQRAAAEAAFGDLGQLENQLISYMRAPRMMSMRFAAAQLETGPISIAPLGTGPAAVMELVMRSRRGVNSEQAAELVAEIRPFGASYPADAFVQAAVAEAEFDAGNDAAAIAAADAALAADPANVNAHIQKGYALMRMAAAIEDDQPARVAGYRAAAEPFLALNALENEHPLPLLYYYRSFTQSGRKPGNSARAGLVRALEIAPFDFSLRMEAVMMHLRAGAFVEAGPALQPIAFSPHGGPMAAQAAVVLDRIGQGNLGDDAGQELIDLLTTNPDAEAAAAEEG